jgi:hypothetical protein
MASKVRRPMRHSIRALLAGGLGLAASLLVACGGSGGLLSAGQANNLSSALDQASAAVSAGQCGQAQGAVNSFNNQLAALPGSINATLRSNLNQGANTVGQLAAKDCLNVTSTATNATTNTTPTNTTPTTTTPANTRSTSSSSTSTSTPTPPPVTTPPATTSTPSGSTSTGNSGGAGIGGGSGGSGGAGTGNGNGSG